uniref:Phenylalanine--tRNA ligase alpha subunit n=1 Tax=Fervidicoccus fontis TaxID=683846 RepID=A0A7J3ZJA1_9CREN
MTCLNKIVLSESERKVLSSLLSLGGALWSDELSRETGIPLSTLGSIIELLKSRGLVREEIVYKAKYEITKAGEEALREGFPEEKLLELLREMGGRAPVEDVKTALGPKASIAIGEAKRSGLVRVEGGEVVCTSATSQYIDELREALIAVREDRTLEDRLEQAIKELERRGLVRKKLEKRSRIRAEVKLAEQALKLARPIVSRLTFDDIVTGRWREVELKEYNVEAGPPVVFPGETHFLVEFIELVKEVLFEMGFEEVEGPFIEQEFWNFDALFQAQDHPSREIHDTFWLRHESERIVGATRELVDRVKRVHETGGASGSRGWGVEWSERMAARWILRTQMTSSTVRALVRGLKVPFRVFSVGKVFRPDKIDAKRLPEFYQLDGIVSDEEMSFSKLLGILKEFFERLGFEKVRFKPAYFPFTEPSVEGYVWMEGRGWVEVFGAGMFRPEVLEIAGFEYNVGAWGMGLDRIAMRFFDINDIRKLYPRDARQLRDASTRYYRKLIGML